MSQANQFSAMIAAKAVEMRRRQTPGGAGSPAPTVLRPRRSWAVRLMMPGALVAVFATMYVGRLLANLLD